MLTHDDVFDVADSIVSKAIAKLGSGVAIVALTGSRVRGTHTPESDLDMFYVPAQDIHASYTIVYRDILFDLFPMSWTRLEAWANYDDPRTSALADSRVVYHRSSEDLQRFEELKATVARLQRPEHRGTMLEKASRILLDAASRLAVLDMHAEPTLTATRSEAVKTLDTMLHCLAVANQTYFSTGFGRNLEEVLALPVRPADIEKQISAIVESQNRETIIKGASSLLGSIRALLLAELHSSQPGRSFSELFTAYYPELKGGLSKLYSACRTGNRYLAVSAAIKVQHEVAQFLYASEGGPGGFNVLSGYADYESTYDRHGLPDLVGLASSGDLGKLRMATDVFDTTIRELIRTHGVALNEVTSLEEMTDELWNAP